MVAFFIMDYLFVYDDAMSVLEVSGDTIRTFLGGIAQRIVPHEKLSA